MLCILCYACFKLNEFFAPKDSPAIANEFSLDGFGLFDFTESDKKSFFQILLGVANLSVCLITLVALCIPGKNMPMPDTENSIRFVEFISPITSSIYGF